MLSLALTITAVLFAFLVLFGALTDLSSFRIPNGVSYGLVGLFLVQSFLLWLKSPYMPSLSGFQVPDAVMTLGLMGGSMQPQGHTQLMVRMADYGQNPQAAADAPRWRIDKGLALGIEQGVSADVIAELKNRGHQITIADRWSTDFGRAQLIFRMEDGYLAASERRTDGQAVGF